MASEYVRLSNQEAVSGHSFMLRTQLDILRSQQRFQNYKKLRKETFILKIALKQKIEELIVQLDELQKTLPKSDYLLPPMPQPPRQSLNKRDLTLEQEINQIRAKLARLQSDSEF
jgi:uncharacterized protein (DUF342 family)